MNTPKDSTGGCCPPPPCSAGLNERLNYWASFKVCPKCRGYELERSWCDHCGKSGVVRKSSLPNADVEARDQ